MPGLLRGLGNLVGRYRLLFLALWIAGLAALAPLSLLPQTVPPTAIDGVELSLDKLFHLIAYGGLAGLATLVFADRRRRWVALAIVLLTGLGYEIGQRFVPGRSFGWDDLTANAVGVALGAIVGRWIAARPARRPFPRYRLPRRSASHR
jgi:VanZ family protein